MYVLITKSGGKYFRLDYRFAGKRKTLALGVYPEIFLKEAREKRNAARKLISDNIDPLEAKKTQKLQLIGLRNYLKLSPSFKGGGPRDERRKAAENLLTINNKSTPNKKVFPNNALMLPAKLQYFRLIARRVYLNNALPVTRSACSFTLAIISCSFSLVKRLSRIKISPLQTVWRTSAPLAA